MSAEFTKYETRGAYHWEEVAERLPNRYAARRHALYGFFLDEIRFRAPKVVLDVGCGDAALTHLMSEATDGRVVGVEPEPSGVELAESALRRADSRATVLLGRGEALPYHDGSIDVVTLCEVIEHIDDPEPLLAEAARVLSPNGVFLLSTPQWQKAELRPFHVREYRGHELDSLLRCHFAEARVQVSEPGQLQDRYMSNRWARTGLNLVSQVGANPFRVRRPATAGRAGWRQLFAVAYKQAP